MTQVKTLRTLFFGLVICLASCKLSQNDSKQASQDTGEFEQRTTLAISEEIPTELQAFIEVVSGKSKRMHDHYFSQVFSQKFGSRIKISSDVQIEYTKDAKTERGSVPFKVTDVYRGVVVGDRVLVFQKTRESGGPAEAGPWWHAVKSYPMSLLVNKSVEEKIKFGLNTEIYEKREIGKTMEQLDAVEFGLNFVPMYGGAKDYFYDGKSSGIVWMIGDAASLGLGSKIKAVANTSRAIVISASSVRIANGINQATQGTATASTGVDVALATLEGTLAAVGFINIKFKLKGGAKANRVDEIVEGLDDTKRVFASDAPSAELIAKKLGRQVDEVNTNGISREEFAKLTNRTIKQGDEVADTASSIARKIPEKTQIVTDSSIEDLLKRPFQGKISDLDIAEIQKKIAGGEFPTPLEIQKLLTVSTPKKPTAFVNVTQNDTVEKVLESDGLYWGYIGFMNLPKGIYATSRPIAWNAMDLMTTAGKGGSSGRNSMIVMIGDAAKEFGLVKSEGALGTLRALSKTVLKRNAEYATNKGDVLFKEFKLYNDGQRNILVVSKVEMPGSLRNSLPGSNEYKKLVRIPPSKFADAVLYDVSYGVIVAGGSALSLTAGLSGGVVAGDYVFGTNSNGP
jgi:hypothetical protein